MTEPKVSTDGCAVPSKTLARLKSELQINTVLNEERHATLHMVAVVSMQLNYSHSVVPGGLAVKSYRTREIP